MKELDKRSSKIHDCQNEIKLKNQQILDLQSKVHALEMRLKVRASINNRSLKVTEGSELLHAREEVIQNLCEKYGKAVADLQTVTADYKSLQVEVLKIGARQTESESMAQEAITAAVVAKVRTAELEEENTDLISQLINLKVRYLTSVVQLL